MKRRRNSRKFPTGSSQVPTNKNNISHKNPTNKSAELAHKKNPTDSKKSSNENVDKEDSTERSWANEVEYDVTHKDNVNTTARDNISKAALSTDEKDKVVVLSGNDEGYNIDRKARPFLRQTRRNKSKNKALITGFAKVQIIHLLGHGFII